MVMRNIKYITIMVLIVMYLFAPAIDAYYSTTFKGHSLVDLDYIYLLYPIMCATIYSNGFQTIHTSVLPSANLQDAYQSNLTIYAFAHNMGHARGYPRRYWTYEKRHLLHD
jgi:hypothetical protein